MPYDSWPIIRDSCPICEAANCAIYRGYYSRFLFCSELEFTGRIVMRTGFCKSTQTRFSLMPEFILPRRRISLFSLQRLQEARSTHTTLLAAIDELTSDLDEEFFLPVSTAHSYLKIDVAKPP